MSPDSKDPKQPKHFLKNIAWITLLTSHYEATVIKIVWSSRKTDTDKRNRIDSPEINPHSFGQLIYNKGSKKIHWKCIFKSGTGKTG